MSHNIYGVFGTLIQGANFETLKKAYDMTKVFSKKEHLLLEKEPTLMTFLIMLQEEYDYRTPCDECREEVSLDSSARF